MLCPTRLRTLFALRHIFLALLTICRHHPRHAIKSWSLPRPTRKPRLPRLGTTVKEARAQKKERSLDPTYRPARKEDDADDIDGLPVEQPGAASKRNADDDNKCCCQRMLSTQPDFSSECSALQHAVETPVMIEGVRCLRHLCFFLPKFHCELNWIERMRGASKAYARAHCAYTLQGLRETVPLSLSQDLSDVDHMHDATDLPVAPLYLQRRWASISRQYMHEYRKGADACEAIRAVTEQRTKPHARHRDTSDSRCRKQEAEMAALSSGM